MEKVLTKYLSAHTQKDYAFIDWSTTIEGANTVSEGNDSMILNCTDTSGYRGYGFYRFPCSPGAIVEASAWMKDTDTSSPHNARVAIDFSSTDNIFDVDETVYEGTTSKNMWEHVKVIGIAPATTKWSRITFGYWAATYGSCEIRDIVIKIYNNNNIVPTIKTAVIRKVDALVGWEIDSRFINTGIASVSDEGTYLLITYSQPFSSLRPSAFIGEEYIEGSHAYKVKASYSMAETCKVSFYSEANNTLVNPADIDAAETVYFNFLAIGW